MLAGKQLTDVAYLVEELVRGGEVDPELIRRLATQSLRDLDLELNDAIPTILIFSFGGQRRGGGLLQWPPAILADQA